MRKDYLPRPRSTWTEVLHSYKIYLATGFTCFRKEPYPRIIAMSFNDNVIDF